VVDSLHASGVWFASHCDSPAKLHSHCRSVCQLAAGACGRGRACGGLVVATCSTVECGPVDPDATFGRPACTPACRLASWRQREWDVGDGPTILQVSTLGRSHTRRCRAPPRHRQCVQIGAGAQGCLTAMFASGDRVVIGALPVARCAVLNRTVAVPGGVPARSFAWIRKPDRRPHVTLRTTSSTDPEHHP